MQGRLDLVHGQKRVIGRASLKHEGSPRPKVASRRSNAALPHLLLAGDRGHDVHLEVSPPGKLAQCQEQRRHTRAAVECLAHADAALPVAGEARRRHDGLANPEVKALARLLRARGPHVQDEGLRHARGTLGLTHEMRRLHADGAVQPLAPGVSDQHVLAGQGPVRPAPEGHEGHGAVGVDGLHHAAHLVAVRVEHDAGAIAVHTPRRDQGVAQGILLDVGPALAEVAHHRDRLVLEARGGLCVRETLEQADYLVFIEVHLIPPA